MLRWDSGCVLHTFDVSFVIVGDRFDLELACGAKELGLTRVNEFDVMSEIAWILEDALTSKGRQPARTEPSTF